MKKFKPHKLNLKRDKDALLSIIKEICAMPKVTDDDVKRVFGKHPDADGHLFSKSKLNSAYHRLKKLGEVDLEPKIAQKLLLAIQKKRIRTLSGVTPVTVLTKPYPCPGKCIFCPNDVRMPKSYLASEPGAQRAYNNKFDPYFQTFNRLVALKSIGHPTNKVELIVLGGTWTSYPLDYQIWFIKRCFEAMNDFGAVADKNEVELLDTSKLEMPFDEKNLEELLGDDLSESYNKVITRALKKSDETEKATWRELAVVQEKNEKAKSRCIGLVIETRPDELSKEKVKQIRKLGATKVQIGIQTLNDEVLELNNRGHTVTVTRNAFNLLRQAGFKIHAHWMCNLYGSNSKKDVADYQKIFSDLAIKPDELKIYPCTLLKSAELMKYYQDGRWKPYTEEELAAVLIGCYKETPRYCRLTRVIRDFPSDDIVSGNKKTNFRQIVEKKLLDEGVKIMDVRGREIKDKKVSREELVLKVTEYETDVAYELFLEFVTESDQIAGFMRLSLLKQDSFIEELTGSAIIREIHIYGQSVEVGEKLSGKAQHIGLGKELIEKSKEIARKKGFEKLSVISSVGTREYYRRNGFKDGELYQFMLL